MTDLSTAMIEIKTGQAITSQQIADKREEVAKNSVGKWMKLNEVGVEELR